MMKKRAKQTIGKKMNLLGKVMMLIMVVVMEMSAATVVGVMQERQIGRKSTNNANRVLDCLFVLLIYQRG